MTVLVFPLFELRTVANCMRNLYFHILSQCFSLSLPGSSIFLACWCLCCLWSGVCLFACTGLSFLFHPCLCAWNSAEQGKSGGRTKPQDLCQWPGHHSQGTRTIGVFTPSLLQCFAFKTERIVFSVPTPSWNFLMWTCLGEKGWQMRGILQRFSATVRAQGYILGWQNHKALRKH